MADLVIRPEDIIDGIKLDVNRIGYINYETLANKPDLSQYITIGNTYGKLNNKSVGFLIDNNYQLIAYSARISGDFEGNATINAGTIGGCQITNGKLRVPFSQIDNIPDYIEKGIIYGSVNDGQTGILINTNGKLKARDADVNGTLGGTFNGEVTATKLTLDNIKIPASNLSGLSTVATTGKYTDLDGKPNLSSYFQRDIEYGIIDDKNMPGFSISTLGKLKATNAYIRGDIGGTFTGTINNSTLSGCIIDNLVVPTKLSGTYGNINLNSETETIYIDGTLQFGSKGKIEIGTSEISSTNILLGRKTTIDGELTVAGIQCSSKLKFYDYSEIAVLNGNYTPKDNRSDPIFRHPIASVGTDGLNVGYIKAKSTANELKPQLGIMGQWGTEDADGKYQNGAEWGLKYIYMDSQSDIRLKENIKQSTINALPIVMNMPVREFDWKKSKVHQPLGLVADEIEKLDPLLTMGGGYNSDGSMDIKNIDRLLLTEYAIKAIQEQQIIIDRQQKEINALKDTLTTK